MTKTEARRKFGSDYHIALICGVNRSAVSRWKGIPEHHVAKLRAQPAKKLKRGGLRSLVSKENGK